MILKLAARNIFRHKLRTTLTVAAIALGVVGLVLTGGFVEDVLIQLREATIHSQLGHLQIYKQGYFAHGSGNPYKYVISDAARIIRIVDKLPQVADVMARLNFSGMLNNGRADLSIIGEGVEPEKEARLGSSLNIVAGRQLAARDDYGALLGQGVADAMKLKPGDNFSLLLNTAEGALNTLDFVVIGVFQSFSKDYDARAVRIPLAAAQELLVTRAVNSVVLSLRQTHLTDQVGALIKQQFAAQNYDIKTWIELADFYQGTKAFYQRQFTVLQGIILVMVLLSVVNSVNMSIFERTGEFGTLMALGNPGRSVFRLLLIENALLGTFGAMLGVVIGIAAALVISALGISMPPPPNSNSGYTAYIRLVPSVIVISFMIGSCATFLAAFLPARQVTRVPIAEALRKN